MRLHSVGSLFHVALLIVGVTRTGGATHSWESPRCTRMFSTNDTMLFREEFRQPPGARLDHFAHDVVAWPPSNRSTVDEFYSALPPNFAASPTASHIVRSQAALVNHHHRCIYVKNLKCGSSTAERLVAGLGVDSFNPGTHKSPHHNAKGETDDEYEYRILDQCSKMDDPASSKDCDTHYRMIRNIPDFVIDKYFIFTFVRDPFTRMTSSYRQSVPKVIFGGFSAVLVGTAPTNTLSNPHLGSQVSLIFIPTKSGKRMRLDFVGHVERMSEDWGRMQPALSLRASKLTPEDRLKLVLTHFAPTNLTEVIPKRQSEVTDRRNSEFVPTTRATISSTERFSQLHVVLVCRRYIQDLVCFNFDIPHVCTEHRKLVL